MIIDCTADEGVARHYADWLKAGIHVVTPNKKANSGPLDYYESLKSARKAGSSSYLYEATVGAGLPVISTLRDLRETGDKISSVEGIFSGTLAYLFNVYDGKKPFSEIVKDAKAKGYTEPDPRDDLSGTDFVRKVIILGREMGLKLEMKDVQVESLIPPGLEKGTIDDFLAKLPQFDERHEEAFRRGGARAARCCVTWAGSPPMARPRWVSPSSTGRMPSPISRSPTTWCATPRRATTPTR